MPRSKKKDDTSDSDSGPDDRTPAKKAKTSSAPPAKSGGGGGGGGGDELAWDLGKSRFVKLTEFKGKWYINIREFYMDGADLKPGKKGIMLTMEQWQKFKSHFDDIEEAIKKNV